MKIENLGRYEALLALSLAFLSAGFTAYLAVGNSHFYGDDFWLFTDLLKLPLGEYLLTPIDVHFVPLHRLFTALIYRVAPLDFRLAVGVMATFHFLGVVMLYKTLQQLQNSTANAWLALVYASNLYVGALLFWWAPGILRLPYIFFAIATIYNYLLYRRTHGAARLLLVVVCFIASLGFFSKAVLIPVYLLGIEIYCFDRRKIEESRRNALCIGLVAVVGILWLGFSRSFVDSETLKLNLDVASHFSAHSTFLAIVHQGAFGLFAGFPASPFNTAISILWMIAIAASIFLVPRLAIVWCVGLALLALNVQMIAMSSRMQLVAEELVTEHRYYFDLMFVGVLFLAPVIHGLHTAKSRALSRRNRRILHALGVALALGIVATSHANFVVALDTQQRYLRYKRVKGYVNNVERGLARLHQKHPEGFTISEGRASPLVLGLLVNVIEKQSQFLPAFGFDSTQVVKPRDAEYFINKGGLIMKSKYRPNPQ